MYVVVQHQFTDPRTAWTRARAGLSQLPAGLTLHHSFPTADGSRAACLWEGPSVGAVQEFVDRALAGVGSNEYFQVENKEGIGLPSRVSSGQSATSETDRNVAIVTQAYEAFGRGEIAGVLAILDEDVDWQPLLGVGSHVPMAGKRRGRSATAEFFATLAEHLRFDTFEPREFIGHGDRVVVLGRYSGGPTRGTETFAADWAMAFKLRNGKIVEFKEFTDSAAVNAAFATSAALT